MEPIPIIDEIKNMKICNKQISDKCITLLADGAAIPKNQFPAQRRECHECYKHRLNQYYQADKAKYIANDKAYTAKKRIEAVASGELVNDKVNDFSNGKIYKLVNSVNNEIYIGSTCLMLKNRKWHHKSAAKIYPDRKVYKRLNEIGWDHIKILQVERFPCQNRGELLAREQYHCDTMKPKLNTKQPHPLAIPVLIREVIIPLVIDENEKQENEEPNILV